jgi:hypothetical protein
VDSKFSNMMDGNEDLDGCDIADDDDDDMINQNDY